MAKMDNIANDLSDEFLKTDKTEYIKKYSLFDPTTKQSIPAYLVVAVFIVDSEISDSHYSIKAANLPYKKPDQVICPCCNGLGKIRNG